MDRPVRKPIRLKNYDYSAPGAYFITVCTREKRCILSSIAAPPGEAHGRGKPMREGQAHFGRGKPLPYYYISPSSRPKDTPGAAGSRTNSSL